MLITRRLPHLSRITILLAIFVVLIALQKIFSGEWMLPQFFSIGPITIFYYGIAMALAVGLGWWSATSRAQLYSVTSEIIDKWSLWVIGAAFVGARLYHVGSAWQYYSNNLLEIFLVWHGGLSIFGALFGGLLMLSVMAFRISIINYKFTILNYLDWLAPSFVLGQIIGRFGNLFNYEAYGYPTSLPWKMYVPEQFRVAAFIGNNYFHPLFLYEALGNVGILILLLVMERRNKKSERSSLARTGQLFFTYIILYNTLRFGLEHLRIDSTFIGDGLRLNALVSAALIIVGIAGFIYLSHDRVKSITA